MKIIGERAMSPYMEGLDDIRKTKIKEFFEVAVVKAKEKPAVPPPVPKAGLKKGLNKKPPPKATSGAPPPSKKEDPPVPAVPARGPPAKPVAPKPAAPGSLKLKKPGAPLTMAPPPTSPKRAPIPPSVDDEQSAPARSTLGGRGLTSRPLPAAQPTPQSPVVQYVDNGLSAADRAELEDLRNEKEQWLRSTSQGGAERTRLLQQINDLQIQVRKTYNYN